MRFHQNNRLPFTRSIFRFAAVTAIMPLTALSAYAAPEPPLPTGWTKTENGAQVQYTNADGTEIVLLGPNQNGNSPDILVLAKGIDQPGACEGLSKQKIQQTQRGVQRLSVVIGAMQCAVYLDNSTSPAKMALAMGQSSDKAVKLADTLTSQWGATPAARQAASQAQPVSATGSGIGGNDTLTLSKAITAVPAAHRPVGWVVTTDQHMSGVVLVTSQTLWMIFANGYATDCVGWDPSKLNPTPAGLAGRDDCDVVAWRKSANLYELAKGKGYANGGWQKPLPMESRTVLTRGQKLNFQLENWDGSITSAINGMGWGGVTASDLTMLSDGTFVLVSKTHASNVYDTTDSKNRITGTYYVDGHIMATQVNGKIELHFIGAYDDDMLFLDGKVFSPDRTKKR